MAYYLQMDGVDDYIQCPSMTFDAIELDFLWDSSKSTESYIIDARTGMADGIIYNGSYKEGLGNFKEVNGGIGSNVYVNDSVISNSSDITRNVRILLKAIRGSLFTDNVTIFARNNLVSTSKGNIYDIKFYNNTTLVAHYDMTTQSVQDQSGNGNHATLNGGTWVDDGTGGSTGTPVTYDYDIINQMYADRQSDYNTNQLFYVDRINNYNTKQSIYANLINDYVLTQQLYEQQSITFNTEQVIYKTVSTLFDTLQEITSSGIPISVKYDMLMSIHADRQDTFDTVQSYFKDVSLQADLKQAIYKLTQTDNLIDIIIYANRTYDNDTKQTISSAIQQEFDTLQQMYQSTSENYDVRNEIYRNESIDIDTKQIIYKLDQMEYALKQAMYKSVSVDFDTLQKMLSDYKEYRQVIEYVLQISTGKNFDLDIALRKKFDINI